MLQIEPHSVHLWRILITDLVSQEAYFTKLLNSEELARASRFRFPIHRQRFAIARGVLREILSQYTGTPPQEIIFSYGPRGKPYLQNDSLDLQFNVSHSEDVAVYALTQKVEIGVDIQKIEEEYHDAVAKRFFSEQEYTELCQLPESERSTAFCRLWASKEAIIKAVGEGLYVPLGKFSVDLHAKSQQILLSHERHQGKFYLESFNAHPDYCSAFATQQNVKKRFYWQWVKMGFEEWKNI